MPVPVMVPDASVLLKWALKSREEEDRDKALSLRESWLSGKCRIVVPSLWAYEVGNVLGLKEPRLARDLLGVLIGYKFDEARPADLYGRILELMSRLKVTFYDAAYHAAALEHQGTLVTADSGYAKKAASLGHLLLLRDWVGV